MSDIHLSEMDIFVMASKITQNGLMQIMTQNNVNGYRFCSVQ